MASGGRSQLLDRVRPPPPGGGSSDGVCRATTRAFARNTRRSAIFYHLDEMLAVPQLRAPADMLAQCDDKVPTRRSVDFRGVRT